MTTTPDNTSGNGQQDAEVRPIRAKRPCADCAQQRQATDDALGQLRGEVAAVSYRSVILAGIGVGAAMAAALIALWALSRTFGQASTEGEE